jgi:hypothetical protein
MNKEQQELLDEAYKNYEKNAVVGDVVDSHYVPATDKWNLYIKEEFIGKIKIDDRFAKKWGLKIEERELTWDESNEYYNNHQSLKVPYLGLKVPTKLITITYNDKKIESYEYKNKI